MRRLVTPMIALLAATFCSVPLTALARDAEAGKALVDRWCRSCHVDTRAAASASDQAPTFAQIAKAPECAPDRLRTWLADPHPPMPDLSLSRAEIENVVAYICSLARE